jgi:hypothetical protein
MWAFCSTSRIDAKWPITIGPLPRSCELIPGDLGRQVVTRRAERRKHGGNNERGQHAPGDEPALAAPNVRRVTPAA